MPNLPMIERIDVVTKDLTIRALEALVEKQDDEFSKLIDRECIQFEIWTDLIKYLGKKNEDNLRIILSEALTPEGQEFVKGFVNDLF